MSPVSLLPGVFRAALRRGGVFLVFALLVPSVGASRAEGSPGSNVLLITVDTLRADHLGCYGYRQIKTPRIDELARDGVRFKHAYAQVPLTLPSHAAILSGTYPMYNQVRDFTSVGLPPSVGIISEAFRRHGFATAAFVSAYVLDGSWGLRKGFDVYDDRFDPRQYETRNPGNIQRRGAETVDRFLAWFARRPSKPFFVWIHLYDPHSSYDPPEPFHSQYAGRLYDGEIAYTDAQLGRVFKALQGAKVYDRTLVAFLSDHGESLGDHGEDEHGFFIYNSTIQVPLIIKPPGASQQQGGTIEAVASTVDVAPTLLQLARIDDPLARQFQGRSLAGLISGRGTADNLTAYAETYYPLNSFGWSPLHSLITRRYAYIDAPQPELYDLERDPGEKQNIYTQHRAEANAFKAQLDILGRRFTAKAPAGGGARLGGLSQETLEKLKSLGYLAYSAPAAASGAKGDLADPKSKVNVFRAILRATELAEKGRFEESARLLQEAAKTETHLYLIPFMLAENDFHQGRLKRAQEQFLACLKLNPDFLQAIRGLARAYRADGQNDKARPLLELAIHKNPHDFLAYYGLGLIASEGKQYGQAITHFQAALREKPDYSPAYLGLGIALVESWEYEEALPNLERAASLGPQEATLLNYLGIATAHTGHAQQAVELYLRALAQKPDYFAARLNLAMTYKQLGEREKAQREFKILCDAGSSLCQQFRYYFE